MQELAGIEKEMAGLFLMIERHWKLINIVAKLGNICFGRKRCVREIKMFLTSGKDIFCFRAAKVVSATYVSRALNWETFASSTMFPSVARP